MWPEQQQGDLTKEACEALIKDYEPNAVFRDAGKLSLDGFTRLMTGEMGMAFNPKHQRDVYQV